MDYTDETNHLRVRIDTHHFTLSQAELDKLLTGLDGLGRQVANFPISDLHLLIEFNSRGNDYSIKTALILCGARLVANDHDLVLSAAFERCLDSLIENVHAYKDRLGQVPERQKHQQGTHQDLEPNPPPDSEAVERALAEGDYAGFRSAMFGYEEGVRKRVGRWVERYPEVNGRIDAGLKIEDLVEEVFLTAFENYESRPKDIRLGDWLLGLIDPAVKELQRNGTAELENIRMARAARVAQQGPGAI
jgi:hypothetical protein